MYLLFDLYGVLLKTQSDQALRALEHVTGADENLWPVYWKHRPDFDAGRVSAEEYWELVRKDLQLEQFEVAEAIDTDYAGWLQDDPEMVAYVRELTKEHTVGLLSNIPEGLAQEVLKKHTWLEEFDSVAMSYAIGVEKPEPRAYEEALKLLGGTPAETWFFDDNQANVTAATEFGLKAYLFTGIDTVKDVLE